MIHVVLSTKCEDHLDKLADVYEDATGQLWNPAEFIENMILALDPDDFLECISEDLDA